MSDVIIRSISVKDKVAGSTEAMPDEDISIVLQRYLAAEVQLRKSADPAAPANFLEMLLSANVGRQIPSDRDYLTRIAQVAYERYTARHIDENAPTVTIVLAPLTKRRINELLGIRPNYAMVFGAESIYFQDTVHALALDSHCHGGVNVLGVHTDWIAPDGRNVRRALLIDETGIVKEMAFAELVPVHIVQILHLSLKNEQKIHRELSLRFCNAGIPQINPYADSSERADNKACTHALWEKYEREIASPKYVLIPQGNSWEEISQCLGSLAEAMDKSELVVQTNRGTEGYMVEKFNIRAASGLDFALSYIRDRVLSEDDAIVREKRGNVRYRDESLASLLNVTFRVNVAWNGSDFVAESGYAQIAKDDTTFAASRGRGGRIMDINEALSNLYCARDGKCVRFIPADGDVAAMKNAAIRAADALNAGLSVGNYLKLMGIDILLEVDKNGSLTPVVLEANPRPAGLSYSSKIMGISCQKPQPQISMEIFRYIVPHAASL